MLVMIQLNCSGSNPIALLEDEQLIEYPNDLQEKQGHTDPGDRSTIGGKHEDVETIVQLCRADRWRLMKDTEEFRRLHDAIKSRVRKRKL